MALTRIDSYLVDLDSLGGITFDDQAGTPTFKVDATHHRVGIGHNSPQHKLDVVGNINISSGSNYLVSGSPISTADVAEHASYLYYTDARVRSAVSITDSGGDGSLSYDSGTGVITYTGPSAAEVRAHFTAGSGISITNGSISVDDDSHNHLISNIDGLQSALDLKAPLASPALTGTPTAPTAASGTNTTQIATTAFVGTAVANLVDSAPTTLDTLNELAAALGDDANFSTTVTDSIATKLPLSGGQMTGNITFSGSQTVDGRDLSADGSKLDGIESGATADQTASEILTSIKTVDGSGSGLDADLLDGISSGSFLRSNTNDDFTGTLWGNNVGGTYFNLRGGGDDNTLLMRVSAAEANENISANLSGDYGFNIRYRGDLSGVENALQIDADNQTGTAIEALRIEQDGVVYFGPSPYVGSNVIWHAGNDGSGSGLDAELWDGNQFGSYLNQAVLTTSGPTFANVYVSDWFRNNAAGEGLYNQTTSSHFYSAGSNYWHINSNSTSSAALIFYSAYNSSQGNSSNRKGYVYWDSSGFGLLSSDGSWAYRHNNTYADIYGTIRQDGSNTVWHAGNDGSGSGLDADTLDGVSSGSFLRSDANDNASGKITLNGAISAGSSAKLQVNGFQRTGPIMLAVGTTSTTSFNSTNERWLMNNGSHLYASTASGSYNNKIWTDSNDGSGSGLDADTLDGIDSGSFLRSDAADISTGGTLEIRGGTAANEAQIKLDATQGGSPQIGFGDERDNTGDNYWAIGADDTDVSYFKFATRNTTGIPILNGNTSSQVKFTIEYDGNLWAGPQDVNKIWHAGNDGSGTGLDADTLDGIQASSFLRSDANDSATGTLTVRDVKLSAGYHLQRSNHHSGHLEGSYNNVGANDTKTNPIYTIGINYNPNDASLNSMYGIGYTHGQNASFITLAGLSTPGWGMYVAADGDARIFLDGSNGYIFISGYVYEGASDARLKTNIKPLESALEKVLSIRGVTFDWIDNISSEYEFHPGSMHDIGVIAQEVQAVQPELVSIAPFNGIYTRKIGWKKIQERLQAEENERAFAEGDEPRTIEKAEATEEFDNLPTEEKKALCEDQQFLTVDYKKLSVLLIEAIKEQQVIIEGLTSRIEALENS